MDQRVAEIAQGNLILLSALFTPLEVSIMAHSRGKRALSGQEALHGCVCRLGRLHISALRSICSVDDTA